MKKQLVFSVFGLMLLFAGCDSNMDLDPLPDNKLAPISLSVTEDGISTRAPVTAINSGNISSVGVYGVAETTTNVFPWTATPPLLNLAPATYTSGLVNFSPKVYYPMGGQRLKFYSYYPRTTANSGPGNYVTAPASGTAPVFNFTLSTSAQDDIMYASSTPYGSYTAGTPSLAMSHKLTQIILDMSLLSGLKSVKIVGVKSKGAMDLGTGVVTYSASPLIDIPLTVQGGLLAGMTVPVMIPADVDKYRVDVALLVLSFTYYIRPTSGNFLPGTIYTIKLPVL